MGAFAIGDLLYPVPVWAPAAYGLLMSLPGLAAGLTVGGGWRRGLIGGLLGSAAILAIMLGFNLALAILSGGFPGFFEMLPDLRGFFVIGAVSAGTGAVGGTLRTR